MGSREILSLPKFLEPNFLEGIRGEKPRRVIQHRRIWVNPYYSRDFDIFWLRLDIDLIIEELKTIYKVRKVLDCYIKILRDSHWIMERC